MQVHPNTPTFHKQIAETICSNFAEYLQIHPVILKDDFWVSQIKFKRKGLKAFIDDATKNKNSPIFLGEGVSPTTAVKKLDLALNEAMDNFNAIRGKKVFFGSRCYSNNKLGIYFTIGVWDLESFFAQKGESDIEQ